MYCGAVVKKNRVVGSWNRNCGVWPQELPQNGSVQRKSYMKFIGSVPHLAALLRMHVLLEAGKEKNCMGKKMHHLEVPFDWRCQGFNLRSSVCKTCTPSLNYGLVPLYVWIVIRCLKKKCWNGSTFPYKLHWFSVWGWAWRRHNGFWAGFWSLMSWFGSALPDYPFALFLLCSYFGPSSANCFVLLFFNGSNNVFVFSYYC